VESDFVFVGNFRHPPNADAARRLVRNIFPMILRELPEATLTIVGADPPQDVVDAASDRVSVTGWVDDPSIYVAGAKVILVPLRQGGGLRVKMLEACAAGKAIVASPMAVEGLSLRADEEVRIANSDGEFAASAIALMADPEARARLEHASRGWWEDQHDVGRWSAQYADLYATLGKGAGPP
jgi:glycosyltransferase involved in cell wall biosynthesis